MFMFRNIIMFFYLCINYVLYFSAYMSSPCHIEVILAEKQKFVAKVPKDEAEKKKVSKKKLARQKEKLMHE